ncbi:MAG TPA: serine hydrolase domain-containing protein [Kofleriaceae bacterium]|nr:serine hydrolase domain-containing protein [Kofleriaceae bacterium]
MPGAAIALVDRDGPLWVGGVGVRDRLTQAPMDADTVFRVGSLSKSVVALGVMRLVDQGKLDLDRPLREILPDAGIDNPWEAVAPVTLAQCMEHTAGLDDVRFNEVFTEDEGLSVHATLAMNPRSRVVRWQPGTRHAYSNVGYTLAGRAIEVASGEPFDVYLRREILQPLGIRDADFRRTGVLARRLATGYEGGERAMGFTPFAHRPSASLLLSASDLAKLVQFWIRRGDGYPPIVSRAGLARIERTGTLPYAALATQYGFANYGDVAHPAFARGHNGGMPGFHSAFRYFPELGVGYVMLLNSGYLRGGYFKLRSLLFAYLTRGRTFATPPTPPTPPAAERPGADYFAFASPSNALFAFVDRTRIGWHAIDSGDGVRLDALDGESFDLVPADDGGYRHPSECGSSVRFTTNRDGVPVLVTSYMYAEPDSLWLARARYVALRIAVFLVAVIPVLAALVLLVEAVTRRRLLPPGLVAWPTIASLSCAAFVPVLVTAFAHGVVGVVHPLTIALCALTTVFPVASFASLICAVRWSLRPDRPPCLVRLFPSACAVALAGLAAWYTANGLIGFRTWAW